MKKVLSLVLVFTMLLSMTGCGCNHQWQDATCMTPKTCSLCNETTGTVTDHITQDWVISAVDTESLTATWELPCSVCGTATDTKTEATGTAPVNSVISVSPNEWYNCLLTNIRLNGMGQSIYGYPAESPDGTLLHGLVSMTQMMAVFSFMDAEGNPISVENGDNRDSIHNIRLDAQFTNDSATAFYLLLMIIAINNNSALAPEVANEIAGQIMSGNAVSDNGYTYAMEIVSVEEHKVCVSITAE